MNTSRWNFKAIAKHYKVPLQTMLARMRKAGIINRDNQPEPKWEDACTREDLETHWGKKEMLLWDPERIKACLDTLKIKPKETHHWKPTFKEVGEIDTAWGDQTQGLFFFAGIGPTRGGRDYEHTLEPEGETQLGYLMWSDDPKSDIPFFYLEFKAEASWKQKKLRAELSALQKRTKKGERSKIDPKGSAIKTLIVAVKHDRAIRKQGPWPEGKVLEKIQNLCKQHGCRMVMSFGEHCVLEGMMEEE
jgi:hypothetical protein